jgi:hypothetical protein
MSNANGESFNELFPFKRILGIYVSLTIGIIILFGINKLFDDDIAGKLFVATSVVAIPMILILLSTLTSHETGKNCKTRIQGATIAGSINSLGVIFVVIGLAIIGLDFSEMAIHAWIFASFASGFLGSLSGSLGTNIPFSKPIARESVEYHEPKNEPPSRLAPASFSDAGYEWLHQEDGTTWHRTEGGFPDPNKWIKYVAE